MARPKVPLISKRVALQVALQLIDEEGLDSLSIRRLAQKLQVNGASFYHHFENKDEIVVGAAKLALEEVRVPQGHEEPWEVWLLRNARRLREALIAHPDLAPIMLHRDTLGIGTSRLDATVTLLESEGVPTSAIAPMLEALETYAIGSALLHIGGHSPELPHGPNLTRALGQRAISSEHLFDVVCQQIMDATLHAARSQTPQAPSRRPAKKSARRVSTRKA